MESTRDERADARGSSCEDVDGGLMYPPAAREAKVTTVTCPARTGSAVNIVCGDPGACRQLDMPKDRNTRNVTSQILL